MEMDQDWYEVLVIDNELLGDAFIVGTECVFRRIPNNDDSNIKHFEIFNLHNAAITLPGEQCKLQLRAVRDSKKNVIRARDQGYINWKYRRSHDGFGN